VLIAHPAITQAVVLLGIGVTTMFRRRR